jgi:deoxyribose-phosphate aldolase
MNLNANWHELSPEAVETMVDDLLAAEPGILHDKQILKEIFSFMDLTTLEGNDNVEKIKNLCTKASSFPMQGIPAPAAVCVYPPFVRQAKQLLAGTGISVAAVSGYFPSGQAPLSLKLAEVKYTVGEGADEIDFVISRGKFLEGDEQYLFEEVSSAKKMIGNAHLKVIIETGELRTGENIRKASEIAVSAGADFIKTSTGKIQPAATEYAAFIMLNVIRGHYLATGLKTGFKPAGGIASPLQAIRYYLMVRHILGSEWLTGDLFRIGASRLADELARELADDFSAPG